MRMGWRPPVSRLRRDARSGGLGQAQGGCGGRAAWVGPDAPVAGFDEARRRIRLGAMMPEPGSGERALRGKFMLIFRGGAVSRHDLSPSELQAHVEKWYRWSDELARQGRAQRRNRA